jgi:hypothetical protein
VLFVKGKGGVGARLSLSRRASATWALALLSGANAGAIRTRNGRMDESEEMDMITEVRVK